ncbi:MAG: DNA polymerase III subunit delta' [Fimbriiglobus sp.]|jgi:DNA polymerase-3 subunit delta'|nr:DNA polymerase III subunit delta' [Fimbriiglobus sp.]
MAWTDIRGHDASRQQLLTAFRRGRLGHAYLFVGPDGVGKRRFAVEFTKAVFCEKPPAEFTPCDQCPACAQVVAGTHPDFTIFSRPEDKQEFVIEVAREVVANLALRPARGRGRVCLIEDADTLNEESANCLLKTLEEPPPGAVLILLATSTDTQLSTILSRCQVVRFQPLVAAELKLVLIDQGITEPADLDRLVRLSGGCVGRALALSDKAVADFRHSLLNQFTTAKPDAFALAKLMNEFVADAGKESKAKRERASVVVGMLLEMLRVALRVAIGGVPDGERVEKEAAKHWAVVGDERVAEAMQACVEADRLIDRRVQLEILLERLADRLCRR